MDMQQKDEFEIKQEELIIKDEFIFVPDTECTSNLNVFSLPTVDRDIQDYTNRTNVKTTTNKHAKPYECSHCDLMTESKHCLQGHDSKCTIRNLQKYFCADCPYSTKNKRSLIFHIKLHLKGKSFDCGTSDFRTKLKNKLEKHLLVHTGEKPHQCKLCNYKTTRNIRLKQHLLVHTGEEPYQCKLCVYRTTEKARLKQHVLVHTGEKPHQCKQCDFKTAYKNVLNQHLFLHTGEKPHQCNLCDYKTIEKARLKQHALVHTGEKPHQCKLCDFKTAYKIKLNQHLKVVHNADGPLICHFCVKSFKTKYTLIIHLKSHFDDRYPQLMEVGITSSTNEDIKDSQNILSNTEMVLNECKEFNSMDFMIKEEPC